MRLGELFVINWLPHETDHELVASLRIMGGARQELPLVPIATWLLCNWYRIRYETNRLNPQFRMVHELAAIGGGWNWPYVEFRLADDKQTYCVRQDPRGPTHLLPVAFEYEVFHFVHKVIARQDELGHPSDALRDMLVEIYKEMHNYELTAQLILTAEKGTTDFLAPHSEV